MNLKFPLVLGPRNPEHTGDGYSPEIKSGENAHLSMSYSIYDHTTGEDTWSASNTDASILLRMWKDSQSTDDQ